MGRDASFELDRSKIVSMPDGVRLFASEQNLASLGELRSMIDCHAVADGAELPAETVREARIAVVEIAPNDPMSVRRIDQLRGTCPGTPIITAIAQCDLGTTRLMLRKGVADVVSLPFDDEELLSSLLDVAMQVDERMDSAAPVGRAPVIASVKAVGGAGATSALSHLARSLSENQETGRIAVIDLDVQSGDMASFLGKTPRLSLGDLLSAGKRLDRDLLNSVTTEVMPGVDLVAPPTQIGPVEDIDIDQLLAIIDLARQEYGLLLLDMPVALTNWSLSVLLGCDRLLMFSTVELGSLRQLRRRIDLLTEMGVARERLDVIVTRAKKGFLRGGTDANGISEALGHEVSALLSDEADLLSEAQVRGVLVADVQSKSRFQRDIDQLAERLSAQVPAETDGSV